MARPAPAPDDVQLPVVGGEWTSYGRAHRVGHAVGSEWTPACDMRVIRWPVRAWSGDGALRAPEPTDPRCDFCAQGVQR